MMCTWTYLDEILFHLHEEEEEEEPRGIGIRPQESQHQNMR